MFVGRVFYCALSADSQFPLSWFRLTPTLFFLSSPLADALKSMDNKLAKRQRAFLLFKSAFYKAYVSLACISVKCGAEFPIHSLYSPLDPFLRLI